ncbi:isochorismatase family protein [Microvirga tunisiensis]|uniref:Isochorismatase family protein n=2 Tax=Pannonibacter tanglangensis TaxID=2750084 RepID=A0A7X5J996_9HYPH|nr:MULTISPECIES: isochorismatase family protein [unclassified Pannonibacter]NBN64806.1 isochorismatase family protein [Pannonibacter sp. XCT-34]NBN79307.1 isochorismatase family protein [Pannonibacter sp. XCT-53]
MPNYTQDRLSAIDAALLLIDHQAGIMQLVHDYGPAEFRSNVLALAKVGLAFGLPTILSSSYETGPNGPIIPELLALFPDAPVIRRPGQISAWDNSDFVDAVKATGRRKLIMAGVTTDVCLAFPAMQAAAEGYQVYGVIDASGAHDFATQSMAVQRLVAHGVTPVTWLMVAAELQRDWREPTAEATARVFHEHLLNYGMLIDGHAASQGGAA